MRRGAKVNAERKFFPGYVLVKMDMTDESWHLVKNTPKVTGFLGGKGRPSPISDAEAERIQHQVKEGIERPKPFDRCSRSASRFGSRTVRSPRSTGWWRKSTKSAGASRSRCRSSAAPRRSSSNTRRSRSSERSRPGRNGAFGHCLMALVRRPGQGRSNRAP